MIKERMFTIEWHPQFDSQIQSLFDNRTKTIENHILALYRKSIPVNVITSDEYNKYIFDNSKMPVGRNIGYVYNINKKFVDIKTKDRYLYSCIKLEEYIDNKDLHIYAIPVIDHDRKYIIIKRMVIVNPFIKEFIPLYRSIAANRKMNFDVEIISYRDVIKSERRIKNIEHFVNDVPVLVDDDPVKGTHQPTIEELEEFRERKMPNG